jgi:hypothetical protein
MSDVDQRVDLLGVVSVLHEHLTESLCDEVWNEVRSKERRRQLGLSVLAPFWAAVIIRAPDSLTHALAESNGSVAQGGGASYPRITATSQAFFSRCQGLDPEFFRRLFEAFQARLEAAEPPAFSRRHQAIAKRFEGRIWALDGSSLDGVARRLKVLRSDPRVPIPGMVIALYDVCRGRLARLTHTRELQPQEGPCARQLLGQVPKGTLVLGDRLYGRPVFFEAASEGGVWLLARRNKHVNFTPERRLSSRMSGKARIEEWIGTYGTSPDTPSQRVRLIEVTEGRRRFALVTNVLEPERMSAKQALDLYHERWGVERLFFELKEVLNLHRFYAGNFNAISMQVYAAAIVHLALRVAQARIAKAVGIEPEALSTQKLFTKVAAASTGLATAEITWDAIKEANPGVRLKKPDWNTMPFASARLEDVLVEPRGDGGRKTRLKADGRRLRRLPNPSRKRRA